jgi:hypothetical protein
VTALTEGKDYAFDCVSAGNSNASSSSDTTKEADTLRYFAKTTKKTKKPNKRLIATARDLSMEQCGSLLSILRAFDLNISIVETIS